MKKVFLTTIAVVASAWTINLPGATTSRKPFVIIHERFHLDTLTVYNPVRQQCDHDPLVTASNQRINEQKLRSGQLRWLALSRDMIHRWGGKLHYGDTLTLKAGDPSIDGQWILQDTMHKRFRRRGDLLFARMHRALGRWTNVTITKSHYYPLSTETN
jgi:hypothetical protein